jgi:hypothetical protein
VKNNGRVNRIFKQVKLRMRQAEEKNEDPHNVLDGILVETIARVEVLEEKMLELLGALKE